MANNNAQYLVTGLDFDNIKASLQNFLSSQSIFSDYNFTGSGLQVLLDVLAFNNTYLAWYLNMQANEMFLDSAIIRENVVSIAKQLDYTPQSQICSTAVLNLIIRPNIPNPPATITIGQFTPFTTTIDSISYTFLTNQAYTIGIDVASGTYIVNDIIVQEGTGFTYQFLVDYSIPGQKFVIPNQNIDINTISVSVQANTQNTGLQVFTLSKDVEPLNGTSPVYFIQETYNQQYEIYFGDGIVGAVPPNQSLVVVTYIAGNASAANGASIFNAGSGVGGFGDVSVTTVTSAYGGSERESISSIKFNAPQSYESQNRAVTVADYEFLLNRNYPNIESISVWGGQDSIPPQYGKVFISLKPTSGYVITNLTKQSIIRDVLQPYNVSTVIPEIIDPDYTFVMITAVVKFTPTLTILTSDSISQLILAAINNFAGINITKFGSPFLYSVLVRTIDLTEPSISNSLTTIKIQKRFVPELNKTQNVLLSFNSINPIIPGTLGSTQFVVSSDATYSQPYVAGDLFYFDDDGLGNLRVYKFVNSFKTVVKAIAGSVDYVNGIIKINSFTPSAFIDPVGIKIWVNPISNDVIPTTNNILIIDPLDVAVIMVPNSVN